ncbi:glycoside hydrolase [Sordaria brevicollis]|uniref:Glycoside hydrolase n=1 Tax=Sordaria brevicollis TaxID=83679 RepID=A0AAE0PKZ7_SORBR|nr:glycoside hydrolase [Sordaria brevicollis]
MGWRDFIDSTRDAIADIGAELGVTDEPQKRVKCPKMVFAHYMLGLTVNHTAKDWDDEIRAAKECGIDGFALNTGPQDHWLNEQLALAYQAAERAGGFVLFISFDFAFDWPVQQVIDLINRFKYSPAQCIVDGRPFVSTFEGPQWADNWPLVRQATGDIFLVPDWASLGPHGVAQKLAYIDGAFSWDAWPKGCNHKMGPDEDLMYLEALQIEKPGIFGTPNNKHKYMMGVSPYFYTNLPQWNKNWYCSSESLWYDRWQQILEVQPDFVEIITWNDYGESSYIYDPHRDDQVVPGADTYVKGYSHDAYRAILPHFIQAYKQGKTKAKPRENLEDVAIAWYRRTPASAGHHGETVWGQGGDALAAHGAKDVISVVAITKEENTVTVTLGDGQPREFQTVRGSSYFEIPFDETTLGPVRLQLNGQVTEGPEIHCNCEDKVNFNSVVIQVPERR